MNQLKQTKLASGASVQNNQATQSMQAINHFSNLKAILTKYAPDVFSDRDVQQYNYNKQREELYPEVEQITDKIAEALQQDDNDIVGSTCDEEYLDNSNTLFSVEGIDQSSLFHVLTLHKKARKIELNPNPENIEEIPEARTHIIVDKVVSPEGSIHITKWIQNCETQSNMVLEQVFDGTKQEYEQLDEHLQDMEDKNPDKESTNKLMKYLNKRNKIINTCKRGLKKARAEYHYRRERKVNVIGNERVDADRKMQQAQQDIRRYQGWITKVELAEFNEQEHKRQRKYNQQYQRALDKFVKYQQREIKEGRDPKWEWEDMVAKYDWLKPYQPRIFKSSLSAYQEKH